MSPIVVRHCGASHFDVFTAQEEQHAVAAQTQEVEEENLVLVLLLLGCFTVGCK